MTRVNTQRTRADGVYLLPTELQDLLPGIINQLGPDNLDDLKKIYSAYSNSDDSGAAGAGADDDSDSDGVPELVDNFEVASNENDADDDDDMPPLTDN